MIDIWFILVPILITDLVNPVLFTFLVYAAGTKHSIVNSSLFLLGHTLAYFIAGLILALGIEKITNRLANPQPIDFIIELFIGIILLWVAFNSRKKSGKRPDQKSGELTPVKALGLGAIVCFVGIPFALPYFAALDQILKADLAVTESLVVLVVYNLLYTLPFTLAPILVAILGERSQSILQRINDLLERVSKYLMPILLSLLGFALITDSVKYFLTGEALF